MGVNMKSMKKFAGFGLIELIVSLAIMAVVTQQGYTYYTKHVVPAQRADSASKEIDAIRQASVQYRLENMAWPANMNQLIQPGYYTGPENSPFGTPYQFALDAAGNLQITFDARQQGTARLIAGRSRSTLNGQSTISNTLQIPSQSTVETYFLARKVKADCPECNTLETNINVNNNSLNNINEFDARLATIETAVVNTVQAQRIENVDTIQLGAASIQHAAGALVLNAASTNITGELKLGGALNAQGNDILGVNQLTASRVIASTAQLDDISGNSLNYQNGVITSISGSELDYLKGRIGHLSGTQLNYTNGVINTLNGDSLNYTTGAISNLSGNQFNFATGFAGTLTGNSLSYGSGAIGSVTGSSLNYTTGQFGSMSSNTASFNDAWIGTARGNNLQFTNGDIATLSGNSANYTNFIGGSFTGNNATLNSLTVNGYTTLATVQSNSHTTKDLRADIIRAASVNVTGTISTGTLVASNSQLGQASASSLSVSGQISSGALSTGTITATNGTIQTLSGTTATFNTVNGSTFRGGMFYGDDFVTPVTTTNTNRALANNLMAQWAACVNQGGCQ